MYIIKKMSKYFIFRTDMTAFAKFEYSETRHRKNNHVQVTIEN